MSAPLLTPAEFYDSVEAGDLVELVYADGRRPVCCVAGVMLGADVNVIATTGVRFSLPPGSRARIVDRPPARRGY